MKEVLGTFWKTFWLQDAVDKFLRLLRVQSNDSKCRVHPGEHARKKNQGHTTLRKKYFLKSVTPGRFFTNSRVTSKISYGKFYVFGLLWQTLWLQNAVSQFLRLLWVQNNNLNWATHPGQDARKKIRAIRRLEKNIFQKMSLWAVFFTSIFRSRIV